MQIGAEALEVLRIEHGLARIGVDAGDKTIALEARLNPAISFNKGCYLGQETIERATARGALKKRLYGLRIDGPRAPAQGAPVMLDGKEVGRLTSLAISPRFGIIGLSILHHSAWMAGAVVSVRDADGEVGATVSELPFE
jgi:folate-binding protein YgfZ